MSRISQENFRIYLRDHVQTSRNIDFDFHIYFLICQMFLLHLLVTLLAISTFRSSRFPSPAQRRHGRSTSIAPFGMWRMRMSSECFSSSWNCGTNYYFYCIVLELGFWEPSIHCPHLYCLRRKMSPRRIFVVHFGVRRRLLLRWLFSATFPSYCRHHQTQRLYVFIGFYSPLSLVDSGFRTFANSLSRRQFFMLFSSWCRRSCSSVWSNWVEISACWSWWPSTVIPWQYLYQYQYVKLVSSLR